MKCQSGNIPLCASVKWLFLYIAIGVLLSLIVCPILAGAQAAAVEVATLQTSAEMSEEDDGYIREVFKKLLPTLDSALELKDIHEDLPKRTYIYGKDQRENKREIDQLLDKAIETLNISRLEQNRAEIRDLEGKIKESGLNVASYSESRLSAPTQSSLGTLGKINPMKKSKEDYDELITREKENIESYKERIQEIKAEFGQQLRQIGLTITDDGIDCLLFSVVGDEFIKLVNVFDNLKKVTEQLQQLTEESGEAIEVTERYYGMYVVLNETLDRIQKLFVHSVHEGHIPTLKEYIKDAQNNIDEAKKFVETGGHNDAILEQNIESNDLTITAAQSYIVYLKNQADMVAQENEKLEKNLETARNTLKTVKVSGGVAMLIQNGRKRIDTLMRLTMPELRGFENKMMQREFQRITEEMNAVR